MAAIGTYYFDGTTLANATSVYTNASLTTLAPDGFYSDAGIVRQQLNGILLNTQTCNSCAVACGSGVTAQSSSNGFYTANIDLANSTEAVVVYGYWGASIPDGLKLTFNGQTYNRFTCYLNHSTETIQDGSGTQVDYAGINNATDAFTYMGKTNANLVANSPYNNTPSGGCTNGDQLERYVLSGGNYVAQGTYTNAIVNNNMLGVIPGTSRVYTGVFPKTTLTPTNLLLEVSAPLCGTFFKWEVACPAALPSFQATALQLNTNCGAPTATYYFARNADRTGTNTFVPETGAFPAVGNFVFEDANGATYLNDTNTLKYIIISNSTYLGIRNGVVVSTGSCVVP